MTSLQSPLKPGRPITAEQTAALDAAILECEPRCRHDVNPSKAIGRAVAATLGRIPLWRIQRRLTAMRNDGTLPTYRATPEEKQLLLEVAGDRSRSLADILADFNAQTGRAMAMSTFLKLRRRAGAESRVGRKVERLPQVMVLCACGCGGTRPKYNEDGKERKYIAGHGASATQRRLVDFLRRYPGFHGAEEIAQRLRISPASVTSGLHDLKVKGVVCNLARKHRLIPENAPVELDAADRMIIEAAANVGFDCREGIGRSQRIFRALPEGHGLASYHALEKRLPRLIAAGLVAPRKITPEDKTLVVALYAEGTRTLEQVSIEFQARTGKTLNVKTISRYCGLLAKSPRQMRDDGKVPFTDEQLAEAIAEAKCRQKRAFEEHEQKRLAAMEHRRREASQERAIILPPPHVMAKKLRKQGDTDELERTARV